VPPSLSSPDRKQKLIRFFLPHPLPPRHASPTSLTSTADVAMPSRKSLGKVSYPSKSQAPAGASAADSKKQAPQEKEEEDGELRVSFWS
ncbi:unnamed protein product, partial [Tilletia controversa]